MNCQCNAGFVGSWYKSLNNRNVPAWYCARCDAFAGEMTPQFAGEFRQKYFSIPAKRRLSWVQSGRFRIRNLPPVLRLTIEPMEFGDDPVSAPVQLKLFGTRFPG